MNMNKIQFHEGGQPINLDDLQLLQERSTQMFKALIDALSEHAPVFLMKKPKGGVRIATGGTSTSYVIDAGTLVLDGEVLEWQETDMKVKEWNAPVYICVRRVESDPRVFADGQTRHCRIGKEVYLSLTKDGAAEAYNLFELPILANLMLAAMGISKDHQQWKAVKVSKWYNGYAGTIRFREAKNKYFFDVNVTSSSNSWEEKSEKEARKVCDLDSVFVGSNNLPPRLTIPLEIDIEGGGVAILYIGNKNVRLILSAQGEAITPQTLPLLANNKEASQA